MVDNRKLITIIEKITCDPSNYTTRNTPSNNELDDETIQDIINNYREYPLYIIKYIFTHQHKIACKYCIEYITNSKERKCELIECILVSHGVRVCDIPSMKKVCKNKCKCYSRKYWKHLYHIIMDLFESNQSYFVYNYNLYTSIISLILKTDVLDDRMHNFISDLSANPSLWKTIIKFIQCAELYGPRYGDIIFSIKDKIVRNESLPVANRDPNISKFDSKLLLINTLKKYNEINYNMSKITDNIYITDIEGVKNISILRDNKIDCVVTLTKKSVFKVDGIEYIHIEMDDIETVNFIDMTIDKVDIVDKYIKENRIILVHCFKGISRSVSFVILILAKQGLSMMDALKLIRKKRPSANPNPGFIKQINNYLNKTT